MSLEMGMRRTRLAQDDTEEVPVTRAQKVLARLRQGPATGLDLLKAGGGTRYGARICELRARGHRIHGPINVFGLPDPYGRLTILESIPKTADGWDQYELREG
jgi:hypothetical protein